MRKTAASQAEPADSLILILLTAEKTSHSEWIER